MLGAGCGSGDSNASGDAVVRVWSHQGQEAENRAVREMAAAFNQAHAEDGFRVEVHFFPDYHYTEKLSIAAAGGDMPDVFDLDGPTVAQFADAGLLRPLDALLPDLPLEDFQPAILEQGTYRGTLYALGAFDSAVVLYADRDWLEKAGVDPPARGEAWTWEAFVSACERLQSAGIRPVALHMDVSADEWYTYAFSPLLWSAGGRLISEEGMKAEGVLDSKENVEAITRWGGLFERGHARRSPVNPDPFGSGETAMDWSGHWMARGHVEAKGDRLVVMPLPRLGGAPVAASGSWCWAVSADTPRPEAAAAWMRWVLDPETGVVPVVRANGALPSRKSAYALLPEYEREPFATFRHLQEHHARARPRTPMYPSLTRAFAAALRDIAHGAGVQSRLTRAAREVQRVRDRLPEAGP